MLPTTCICTFCFLYPLSLSLSPLSLSLPLSLSPSLSLSLFPPSFTLYLCCCCCSFHGILQQQQKNVFLYFYVSCRLGLVWFWFLFDRSAYRTACLLACLIGQLLYLALFDWLFSLFLMLVYFSSLGLSLFQRVTVALPGTACCLHPCISMRVFLLSPPPLSLSLSLLCLFVCLFVSLPVWLSVCLSVCLSVSLSVRFCLPPTPPLPLSSFPSFSTSLPPSPCVLCPLFFNLFCFGFSVVVLFCFLSCVFFFFGFFTPHTGFKCM